ncbi:MAG: hypothetical protein QM650_13075 [Microlunatus sp.]
MSRINSQRAASDPARAGRRWPGVLGLVVLCAVGAELLAAYGGETGDPAGVAFSIVFFGALYGAPALLARDVVRRRGWGWPSLLLVFAALGVTQACLIDQSMFSTDYLGYQGWEESREATLVPALRISAYNAYNFVLGHVIYSFGAPVALAEAWAPDRSRQPWLGPVGTVVALVVYLGAAALVLLDPESRTGSLPQLVVSAVIVVGLLVAAALVGRRAAPPVVTDRRRMPVLVVLVATLVVALASNLGGETWTGFVIGIAVMVATGTALWLVSRRTVWSIRHRAVAGLGFLLARGLLAFTYFPLLGEVAAGPKYAHNVVMLLVVLVAGTLALRKTSAAR